MGNNRVVDDKVSQLVLAYQVAREPQRRKIFTEINKEIQGLIITTIDTLNKQYNLNIALSEWDDVYNHILLQVHKSMLEYESTRGVKFTSFAIYGIRQSVFEYSKGRCVVAPTWKTAYDEDGIVIKSKNGQRKVGLTYADNTCFDELYNYQCSDENLPFLEFDILKKAKHILSTQHYNALAFSVWCEEHGVSTRQLIKLHRGSYPNTRRLIREARFKLRPYLQGYKTAKPKQKINPLAKKVLRGYIKYEEHTDADSN